MSSTVTNLHHQVDENEASRRRRAIFKALHPYMPQTQVIEALWMWEWDFSEGSAFELADYLNAVCQSAGLKKQQGEIRRSLIRQMSQPLAALGPDPWPLMRDYANAMKDENSSIPDADSTTAGKETYESAVAEPATKVLTFVITQMLDAMLQQNPVYCARVRKWVAGHLASIMPFQVHSEFAEWLINQSSPPIQALDNAIMRRIVNLTYICGCEYFGPVKMDKLLHQSITAAESLPEAAKYSPRDLL